MTPPSTEPCGWRSVSTVIAARRRLRTIPGIGPFYGDLILIRATGKTDVLPLDEPQLWRHVTYLYGLESLPDRAQALCLAEGWRP